MKLTLQCKLCKCTELDYFDNKVTCNYCGHVVPVPEGYDFVYHFEYGHYPPVEGTGKSPKNPQYYIDWRGVK